MAIRKSVTRPDVTLTVPRPSNFRLAEFRCRGPECAGKLPSYISPALVELLQAIRDHYGASVIVRSGFRCPLHNRSVGGAKDSRHLHGDAADIVVTGVSARQVADFADGLVGDSGGVGSYASFTHVDVRGQRARWRE